MIFHEATVPDILRCHQRDQAYVSDLESQLHSFLKHLSSRSYHRLRKSIPVIANAWYYFMTSLGELQTLGEEYTGTMRLNLLEKKPTKKQQLLWLLIYIGGEPLLERALNHTETRVKASTSLTRHAKDVLLKCIQKFKEQKWILKRIHQSLFYMNGKYYNIANRLVGIRYVLLRQWMQNDAFSESFKLLDFNFNQSQKISSKPIHTKSCILCADYLRNPTATLCGHVFCWDCIFDSLNYQKTCPVCREEVLPNRVILLQNYV